MRASINIAEPLSSAGLPPALPEPMAEDLRLETIMGALADPLRLTVIRKLLTESEAYDHPCGWFGFDRPKSSLTHHFKALREAGLIRPPVPGPAERSHGVPNAPCRESRAGVAIPRIDRFLATSRWPLR